MASSGVAHFEDPEAADVFARFDVGTVRNDEFGPGPADGFSGAGGGEAADEDAHASGDHLVVESVDVAVHFGGLF